VGAGAMKVTAVVLTRGAYLHDWQGLDVCVHRSTIRTAADLQRARFDALEHVRTPHFFFLDDDDGLPAGYLDVLQRCLDAAAPLAYTDELVAGARRVRGPYSQAAHLAHPMLVHHLALYETAAAREAVATLPRGHFAPEYLLAWEVAKRGAAYVPEVGYIWNRRPGGMHSWPATSLSWMRALLWAKDNP